MYIGVFFLLAAAREGESSMAEFVAKKVESESPERQREAVMRFMVLWKVRYKVWPAVGERGQKKFNSDRIAAEERQVHNDLCNLALALAYIHCLRLYIIQ